MRLKELRLSKGITQEELAEKLNVGQNTISQWETGDRIPRVPTVLKLAQVLDCSVGELLEE